LHKNTFNLNEDIFGVYSIEISKWQRIMQLNYHIHKQLIFQETVKKGESIRKKIFIALKC